MFHFFLEIHVDTLLSLQKYWLPDQKYMYTPKSIVGVIINRYDLLFDKLMLIVLLKTGNQSQ